MVRRMRWAVVAALCAAGANAATAPDAEFSVTDRPTQATIAGEPARWTVWGGELRFDWNHDLLEHLGLRITRTQGRMAEPGQPHLDRFALREQGGLEIRVLDGHRFDGFAGGRLQSRGGFLLQGQGLRIDLRDAVLAPRPGKADALDLRSRDGRAWFYLDRLMYTLAGEAAPRLVLRAMDLRISPELAQTIGRPELAHWVVAGLEMESRVSTPGAALALPKGTASRWPGEATPYGGSYAVDVFTRHFDLQFTRRDSMRGVSVFTPNATLRNNRGTGLQPESDPAAPIVSTVPGDPLGTSSVRFAADVPWNPKFSPNRAPYGNDQHPYLVWNLYRIDASGRIEQIGRSGVKHAFLTINERCDAHPGSNYILGRGCEDLYGTANNDGITDLGPRSELIPARGQWGRCGSVYDRDCNGLQDTGAPCVNLTGEPNCSSYAFRMQVRDADIDPTQNPGAQYLAEAWYLVRDDVEILNTMASRPVSFSASGGLWVLNNGSPVQLGPAIDAWLPRGTTSANERSHRMQTTEGEVRIAARVTQLGSRRYRYDYVVMNFDFARAVTTGAEPNLRVLRNNGFVGAALQLPADAEISDLEFADGDGDPANDWATERQGDALIWETAGGLQSPLNPLNWGSLYRFSLTSTGAPQEGSLRLTIAEGGAPATLEAALPVPSADLDGLFDDGFEAFPP